MENPFENYQNKSLKYSNEQNKRRIFDDFEKKVLLGFLSVGDFNKLNITFANEKLKMKPINRCFLWILVCPSKKVDLLWFVMIRYKFVRYLRIEFRFFQYSWYHLPSSKNCVSKYNFDKRENHKLLSLPFFSYSKSISAFSQPIASHFDGLINFFFSLYFSFQLSNTIQMDFFFLQFYVVKSSFFDQCIDCCFYVDIS